MTTIGVRLAPAEHVESISGSDLHYWVYEGGHGSRDDPSAPVVVMLHGLRGTHQGLELISAQLGGYDVVIPDLPGFGASSPMQGVRHDVEGYGGAMLALLDRISGRRPAILLGHSFGSLVAAHVASVAPELVHRLVLVNPISTPALAGPRAMWCHLTSAYYWLGESLPARPGRALLSNRWIVLAASRAMVRSHDKQLRKFVYQSHLQHFSRFHSPAMLGETFEASVTSTVADYADTLRMPILLVAGENDDVAPVEGQRALADRLADAELVVIPEVGHLVHYETPGAAASAIERFIAAPA